MMKSLKKSFIIVFTVALFMALGCFLSLNKVQAETFDGVTTFCMREGVTVRVDADGNLMNSMRFSATVSKTEYEGLTETYGADNVSAGTFIMPHDYVEEYGALNKDNLFGSGAKYFWDGKYEDKSDEEGKIEILQMESIVYYDKDSLAYRINGSVTNIKINNYNRAFIGVCYLEVETDGGTEYLFASEKAGNERTLVYCAQRSGSKGDTIVNDYITAYKAANDGAAPQVKYTVNKTYDDGRASSSEERTAELGADITLKPNEETLPFYQNDNNDYSTKKALAQNKLVINFAFKTKFDENDKSTYFESLQGNFNFNDSSSTYTLATSGVTFYNFYYHRNAVKVAYNDENVTGLKFIITPRNGESAAYALTGGVSAVYPGSYNVSGTTLTFTWNFASENDYAEDVRFYFYKNGNGGNNTGLIIQVVEIRQEDSWVSSDNGRLSSVHYTKGVGTGDGYWTGTMSGNNYYNARFTGAAISYYAQQDPSAEYIMIKFTPSNPDNVSSYATNAAYCSYPSGASTYYSSDKSVVIIASITDDFKLNGFNIMFYVATTGTDLKITASTTCGAEDALLYSSAPITGETYDAENDKYSFISGNGTQHIFLNRIALKQMVDKGDRMFALTALPTGLASNSANNFSTATSSIGSAQANTIIIDGIVARTITVDISGVSNITGEAQIDLYINGNLTGLDVWLIDIPYLSYPGNSVRCKTATYNAETGYDLWLYGNASASGTFAVSFNAVGVAEYIKSNPNATKLVFTFTPSYSSVGYSNLPSGATAGANSVIIVPVTITDSIKTNGLSFSFYTNAGGQQNLHYYVTIEAQN